MTNKRMHKLERKVRVNFQGFNRIICPKDVEIKCLDQITKLFFNRIWYLHYRGNMTLSEAYFMILCVRRYYVYYKKLINKHFS